MSDQDVVMSVLRQRGVSDAHTIARKTKLSVRAVRTILNQNAQPLDKKGKNNRNLYRFAGHTFSPECPEDPSTPFEEMMKKNLPDVERDFLKVRDRRDVDE